MNVIIVGAGAVGFHIAERLSKEGHEIAIIERRPEMEQTLKSQLNALVIRGSGASADVLEGAGIEKAELFIAVADQDEVNLVACLLAHEYHVPRIIARIKGMEYTSFEWVHSAQKLGIDMLINPQTVVAEELFEIVSYTSATEAAEFADGRVIFLGYVIGRDSPLAGLTMKEIAGLRGIYRMIVAAIVRHHETIIPRGADVIQEGDIVYFVCNRMDLPAINYMFGFEKQPTKQVFVLGGGSVGMALSKRFLQMGYGVKVIEPDMKLCKKLAEDMTNLTVLHAEGTDIGVMASEGLGSCDVFVATTPDEQSNILCSLLAKSYGAKRAVALVNRTEFLSLAPSLGVDACVSARLATAAAILRFVRRGQVAGIATLEQSDAEVLELVLVQGNSLLRRPLKDVEMPTGAIIASIVRGDEVIIPTGEDELRPDDHIIIFALPDVIPAVEAMFA